MLRPLPPPICSAIAPTAIEHLLAEQAESELARREDQRALDAAANRPIAAAPAAYTSPEQVDVAGELPELERQRRRAARRVQPERAPDALSPAARAIVATAPCRVCGTTDPAHGRVQADLCARSGCIEGAVPKKPRAPRAARPVLPARRLAPPPLLPTTTDVDGSPSSPEQPSPVTPTALASLTVRASWDSTSEPDRKPYTCSRCGALGHSSRGCTTRLEESPDVER